MGAVREVKTKKWISGSSSTSGAEEAMKVMLAVVVLITFPDFLLAQPSLSYLDRHCKDITVPASEQRERMVAKLTEDLKSHDETVRERAFTLWRALVRHLRQRCKT
jgi:hypothetical protein